MAFFNNIKNIRDKLSTDESIKNINDKKMCIRDRYTE